MEPTNDFETARPLNRARVLACLSALLVLAACGGASSPGVVPMAPTTSSHFKPVAQHLHLGGTAYGYADIDGDPLKAAKMLMQVLADVPEAKKFTGDLTAEDLVRILGLHNLKAIGFSSYKDGEHYHNRTFTRSTGDREGLLKIRGGAPVPYPVLTNAPADSDLVYAQQLDLRAILDMVRAFSEKGVGVEGPMLNAMLKAKALGMDVTWGGLIEQLNTELSVVASFDPTRTILIPDAKVRVPHTRFVVRARGLGFLVDEAAKKYGSQKELSVTRTESMLVMEPAVPLPAPMTGYRPALVHERGTGDLLIASTMADLKVVLSGASTVADTSDFKRAMRNTPSEGNALAYLSPRLTRVVHQLLDQAPQLAQDDDVRLGAEVVRWFLPAAGMPTAWVSANIDDGILSVSNASSSHKARLLIGSGGAAYVGILAAIAVPAVLKYKKRAEKAAATYPAVPKLPE